MKPSPLRELFDLPETVQKSDFVVKLVDGVADPAKLLANYAVTPAIAATYDTALALVRTALDTRDSRGTYVHGSFGAGKSHFMAVLSAILGHADAPRHEPGLHDVLARHDWLPKRKLLRMHCHMLNAVSIEQRVFDAYLEMMATEHPEAPIAPLFRDADLFDNAQQLRETLGDATFFAKLNAGRGGGDAGKWGKYAGAAVWDAASFDAARASARTDERGRLFDALVRTLFPAYARMQEQYVDFDAGLAVIAAHAQALGYDGVVLFLDELILWLAGRATHGEGAWLRQEAEKVSKLVESTRARVLPIVSFIARQRDLVEFVGEELAGADAALLRSSLDFQSGRFGVLTLEDTNLPAIVQKRVVHPRSADAARAVEAAFAKMRRGLVGPAWDVVRDALDEADFRRVYPFSPALLAALVALSNFLQRERTALKVLVELLVEHLPDWTPGQVVSLGDVYDLLAAGEEAMDGTMKANFDAARRLYEHELLHLVRTENGTTSKAQCQRLRDDHPVHLGCSGCPNAACRADNRLLKTLLLAALVPQTHVFRDLSASRLVHLNHGAITSPIPGNEMADAVTRVRKYATQLGKLRVGDQKDPSVQIVLRGVDVKPILASARTADGEPSRRRKLRELFVGEGGFALGEGDMAVHAYDVVWRGSRRRGEVHFGNVRDLDVPALRCPESHDFRVVVDYPFDAPGFGPQNDLSRVQAWFDDAQASMTLVWLPSFFGEALQRELGELVVIEEVLKHPKRYLDQLGMQEQREARAELESLASQKTAAVRRALATAYGVAATAKDLLDPAHTIDDHLHVLWPGLRLQRAPVASLADGLEKAVVQLFEERFPRHPRLGDTGVTRNRLEKAIDRFRQVCEADGQRLPIQQSERRDFEIMEALGLATVTGGAVTVGAERVQRVAQELAKRNVVQPSVARVKEAFGTEEMGVSAEVADTMVLGWTIATNRDVVRGGLPLADLTPGRLPPDADLVTLPLPAVGAWQKALELAGHLFGHAVGGRALNARNVDALAKELRRSREQVQLAAGVYDALERRAAFFGGGEPARLVTARKIVELKDRLAHDDAVGLIESLAEFTPLTSARAIDTQVRAARPTVGVLANEVYFNTLAQLRARDEPEARDILDDVRRVLEADQVAEDLEPRLHALVLRTQEVLRPATPPPPRQPEPPPPPGMKVIAQSRGERLDTLREDVRRIEETLRPGDELVFTWEIRRRS